MLPPVTSIFNLDHFLRLGVVMSVNAIERGFHEKVSGKVRLMAEGTERYRVFTRFRFDDGDLSIVLKKLRAHGMDIARMGGSYLHAPHLRYR